MPFQNRVNSSLPIGVAGDYASANPRASVFAGEGGLVAAAGGLTIGKFAWVEADGITVTNVNPGAGAPDGFVGRSANAARIDTFTAEASMVIPAGFPVTLESAGEFLAVATVAAATRGAAISAANADGSVVIGAPAAGQVATKFTSKSACAVGELVAISTW